jgi:type IV pilus assembly protein PilC
MQATYVAESEARLRHELEDKGLFLLTVEGRGGWSLGRLALPRRRRVPASDFIIFNQELATLLKAGLPLVQSLDILRKRIPNPMFKAALNDIYERVRSGSALSEAFEAQTGMFSAVYNASLMAGEKSGSLEQVLRRYVQHVKTLAAVRSQLVSALIYPVILLCISMSVIGLIVFKVVPQFASFYNEMGHGAELPLSTRMLVGLSQSILDHVMILIGVVVALVVGIPVWLRQPGERKRLDGLLLRAPYMGTLIQRFATAQTSRTIATLLSGGIPLVNAVEIAARAVSNRKIAADLIEVVQQIREGGGLGTSLAKHGTFPDVAIEMVEVGESTGALAEMLSSVADFYDEENRTSLERFGNLVQPMMLVVMGIIIAGLLLALYMPLFNLGSVMS